MDNILDHMVVQGQRYDIVSPTAFGDYIETIGSACINPDGYAQGSTFLARLGNEQFYYEATAAITQGSSILEGTNCKKTTVTGRESELASDIQTLSQDVTSLSEALTNVDTVISTNGAKNLLPNNKSSLVDHNVTFTVNSDGTVTANGTANGGDAVFSVVVYNEAKFLTDYSKRYKLSGCPSGGSSSTYYLEFGQFISPSWTHTHDYGNGEEFSLFANITYEQVTIYVKSGVTVNNLVFKPMITLADQPNSDYDHYVPYAKTNRDLSIVKRKEYPGVTIGANSYYELSDSSLAGKIFAGFAILSSINFNLSVYQIYISEIGLLMIIKNNGSSAVTTGKIVISYL